VVLQRQQQQLQLPLLIPWTLQGWPRSGLLSVCVCACVCLCVFMHIRLCGNHTQICQGMCGYVIVCMRACAHFVYVCTLVCVCMCVCMCVCVCVCAR